MFAKYKNDFFIVSLQDERKHKWLKPQNKKNMAANLDKIRLLFGLKIKQLRIERSLSLSDLARKVDFSISYLNEIEKGKKYPKTDKIFALADALEVDYDSLVSLKLSKHLEPIAELLNSNILSELPLEMFGVDPADFLELMSSAPTKLSAFISTIIEISRNYDMRFEQFYFSVLRSYQEMYDNYFPDIEEEAEKFLIENQMVGQFTLTADFLEEVLIKRYNYSIENYDNDSQPNLMSLRSVFIPKESRLLINKQLSTEQRAFTLGREVGYQFMKINNRPLMSSAFEVTSFEQVFNNFKASYFAGAILINRSMLIRQIETFFARPSWSHEAFLRIMQSFNATPERFLARLTSILPSHFGINQLFFLRFNHKMGENLFYLDKEMHLARLHTPHATALHEHYCSRWVSLSSLRELETEITEGTWDQKPLCRIQISDYIDSNNEYLVLSLAKSSPPSDKRNSSVTLGIAIDDNLRKKINFLSDPNLLRRKVNETCERCGFLDCPDRRKEPTVWLKQKQNNALKSTLRSLGV
jgi:XRE family transcriptional regulator, fatty acid utilization regulator